jgi:hypothetical protein
MSNHPNRVPTTKARVLKSRRMRKYDVRFGSGAGAGDRLGDHNAADRAPRAHIGGLLAFAGSLVLRYTLHRSARLLMRGPLSATSAQTQHGPSAKLRTALRLSSGQVRSERRPAFFAPPAPVEAKKVGRRAFVPASLLGYTVMVCPQYVSSLASAHLYATRLDDSAREKGDDRRRARP